MRKETWLCRPSGSGCRRYHAPKISLTGIFETNLVRFCRLYKTKHTYTIDTVVTCVEIKVSVSDFHSDHGHNFVGHCNYYAMPLALYKKVKDEIPDGIGVLLYYNGENTCGIRKKIECKPRQLSEKTQKWLIISVAKRLTKMSKA